MTSLIDNYWKLVSPKAIVIYNSGMQIQKLFHKRIIHLSEQPVHIFVWYMLIQAVYMDCIG